MSCDLIVNLLNSIKTGFDCNLVPVIQSIKKYVVQLLSGREVTYDVVSWAKRSLPNSKSKRRYNTPIRNFSMQTVLSQRLVELFEISSQIARMLVNSFRIFLICCVKRWCRILLCLLPLVTQTFYFTSVNKQK